MKIVFVYATFETAEQAREISRALVETRLAACANILPAHESLYWWDGAVQSASEVVVVFKTKAEVFDTLRSKIVKLHSYDCPCVVAIPIEAGHEPFLRWVKDETQ
jgi:periplasmic divalent cation tolerance protein